MMKVRRLVIGLMLCAVLLSMSAPLVSADTQYDSTDAGLLAMGLYASSSGWSVSSSLAGGGYSLRSGTIQLLDRAIASAGWADAASAWIAAYPAAASAAAGAAGVSSIASVTTASQLAAGISGSGVAIVGALGQVVLPVAAAALCGQLIYLALANAVQIPAYRSVSYTRYGDIVISRFSMQSVVTDAGGRQTYGVPDGSIGTAGVSTIYPGQDLDLSSLGIDGRLTCYVSYTDTDVYDTYRLKYIDNITGWEIALGPSINAYTYQYSPPSGTSSQRYLSNSQVSPSVNTPIIFAQEDSYSSASGQGVYVLMPRVYQDNYQHVFSAYGGTNIGISYLLSYIVSYLRQQSNVTIIGSDPSYTAESVVNKWISVPGNTLPGMGDVPADEIVYVPTMSGDPIITSDDPTIALDALSTAADAGAIETIDDNNNPVYIPSYLPGIVPRIWDMDADWTQVGNPDATDDQQPSESPYLPTPGILVPWHYVVRLFGDMSEGIVTVRDIVNALLPTFVINAFFALAVILILFGLLHRLLK